MMRADTDTDTPAIDPEQSSPAFTGGIDGCDGHHITGWAASAVPGAPRLVVELLIDGEPCGQIGADLFRSDLAAMHIGDGCHAFALPLPASAFDGQAHQYAVREAESGVLLSGSPLTLTLARALANELPSEDIETGRPITEADDVIADTAVSSSAISRPAPRRKAMLTGRVDSCDGLGAHGWAAFADGRKAPAEVEWLLDGRIVGQISARLLRGDLAASGIGDGRHGFRITLPDSAYDGAMHALEVRSVIDGEPLAGSPLLFRMNPCHLWQRTDDLDEATRRRLADQALVYLEDLPADELQAGLLPQIRQLLTWLQTLPPGRLLKRAEAQRQRVAGSRYRAVICDAGRPDELRVQLTDHWGGDNALGIDLHEGDVLVASQAPLALVREPGHLLTLSFDLPSSLLDGRVHSFTLRLQPDGHALGPLHLLLNAASDPILSSTAHDPIWADTPGAKLARARRTTKTPALTPALTPVQKAQLKLDDADFEDDKPEAAQARRIDLMLELAAAHLHAGDWRDALTQADQALALDPLHLDALCTGVRCLMAAGDDAGAAVRLAAALQACPDAPALHALGDALQGRSRTHRVRTLAFYLPQFHPTPDNNAWWGEGFTEWHNVGGATPLFSGHLQPRRPTTLGYYDLRLPEAVNAQFDLARRYGIDGFCYYYYWFEGRRILERPLDDLVAGRTGPFPFCICWANEDWTRAWDGATGEVLAAQNHAPDSDFAFIQDLAPLLRHPDYIRVDGKPMVLVYRADKLATPLATVKRWRAWCIAEGIGDLHLCAVQSFGFHDPRPMGFDAAVEFPPHCPWDRYPAPPYLRQLENLPGLVPGFSGNVYDYQAFAKAAMARPREPFTLHRTAMVAWDNTARRGTSAAVYHQFSVGTFGSWVLANARRTATEQADAVCFINAWNEWAEGSVLEPDVIFGHQLLETTREVLKLANFDPAGTYWRIGHPLFPEDRLAPRQRLLLVGHDAFPSGAQINLLNMARTLKRQLDIDVTVLLLEGGALLPDYERVAPTHVIGRHGDWRGPLQDRLREWAALGACKAICNTVVTGDVAELLAQAGYRVVGLVHELPTLIEAGGLQAQCWRMADKADALVFASQVVADGFMQRFWPDPRKRLIAPQGIAFNRHQDARAALRDDVRDSLALPPDCQLVIGCGWGDTRKGIDLFVRLAGDVVARQPAGSVAFVWVGGVDESLLPYLQADAKRLGMADLFRITGRTEDPGRYFIAADLFCLTSREDPFPSVVMEAFDAHLPVLAFDGGGGYVDIVNADTGALLPYLDVAAMADAALAYLRDDARRHQVGAHNHQLCRDRFGYVPYLRKLLALLAEVPADQVAAGHLRRQAWAGPGAAPRITAIVPNYNYARYLELRLQTILHQTLPPCEIIVLDDASTDHSVDLVQALAARSSIPITLVRNARNTGNPFVQWAKGLERATGDLVWIAEADDYCEPTLLETLASELVDPQVVMAWADSIMVDDAGHSQGAQYKDYYARAYGSKWRTHFRMAGTALIDDCLFAENVVPNASAVLFRRSALKFDLAPLQKYRFSGDWWFWLMLARSGTVAYRADPLNYHRRHAKSVMGDVLRSGQALLPETMGFYRRVAEAAPDVLGGRTARMALQRLDQLYTMFPALQAQAPALEQHPEFAVQHAGLSRLLGSAVRTDGGRSAVTLVLSPDGLGEGSAGLRLGAALSTRHALQVVVLAPRTDTPLADDQATWGLDPDCEVVVMRTRTTAMRDSPAAVRGHLARSLADALPPAAHVISHGLLANCVLAQLPLGALASWQLVADKDFEALLGHESRLPGVDLPTLAEALQTCSQVSFLGTHPPHALGRLAQRSARPLDRLVMPAVTAWRHPTIQAELCVLAAARGVPAAAWAQLSGLIAATGVDQARPITLRLLSWGEDLAALQAGPDLPGIELVALHAPPSNLESLADAVLVWQAADQDATDMPPALPNSPLTRLTLPWPIADDTWPVRATEALGVLLANLPGPAMAKPADAARQDKSSAVPLPSDN